MFGEELYITITGLNYYFGMKPFQVGTLVILRKEPDNDYDDDAIMAVMPALGKVGYAANSPSTLATGSLSASRIYDKMPDECAAVVRFLTGTKVIARVFPDKKLKVKVEILLEDQPVPAQNAGEGFTFLSDSALIADR